MSSRHCLAPNVPRHLLWQVCPWLTRYHRHRLCPLLIFYALSVMKNMKNRFFCSQYSVQWISWNIDVTSFCSQYYEIYKYRFTTLCSPLCSLPEDIWDDIAIMPLFWCQTFYKGIGGAIFLFSSYHICFRNQNTSMLQIILNLQFYINLHFSPALKGFRDSGTNENAIKIVENWSSDSSSKSAKGKFYYL